MTIYNSIQIEPNKRYGGSITMEKAGRNKYGHKLWKVQCVHCKKIRVAEENTLVKTQSCGCLGRKSIPKIKPGDKFIGLKAIRRVDNDHNRHAKWEAECLICGKLVVKYINSIRNAISCGCIKKTNIMPAIDTFEHLTDKQESIPENKKERGSLNLDPCWIWNGPISSVDSSLVFFKSDIYIGLPISAKKFSLEHFRGISDHKKMPISICGNLLCVNPDHLNLVDKTEYIKYTLEDLKERFWRQVNKQKYIPIHKQIRGSLSMEEEPCWLWEGLFKDGDGYGENKNGVFIIFKDINYSYSIFAHRFSWMLSTNEELNRRLYIIRRCNTPLCVNPAHLKKVTAKEYANEYRNVFNLKFRHLV